MKVLRRSIQVRQRNKRQQGVGLRADGVKVDYVELAVALELLSCFRVEDLHWAAVLISGRRKIPRALGQRRDGGKTHRTECCRD